jgi:hypothetical protein
MKKEEGKKKRNRERERERERVVSCNTKMTFIISSMNLPLRLHPI